MLSPFQRAVAIKKQDLVTGTKRQHLHVTSNCDLELQLLELDNDKKTLKNITSIADKIAHKRDVLVPKYLHGIDKYIEAGAKHPCAIFSTVLVWLFDISDLDTFIKWCIIAIDKKIPTPEHIKRNWETFCADSIFSWAEKQIEKGNSIDPYFSFVFEKIQSCEWRLFEKISAKYYKLSALQLLRNDDGEVKITHVCDIKTLKKALDFLIKADELNPKVGVSDLIKNRIPSRIKALETGKNL